jgi:hypothetical protein
MALIEDTLVHSEVRQTDPGADLELYGIALDQVQGLERLTRTALHKLKELGRIETLMSTKRLRLALASSFRAP